MTSPLGDTTSWSVLMQLAGKVNGGKELTTEELEKLLKEADANGDGIIELAEFKDAFMSAEEYANLEDEFLEAFEAISEMDGVEESISQKDIDMAIEEFEESQKPDNPPDDRDYNPPPPKDPPEEDLSTKQLPVLKSERSEILSDISSKRAEKEQALAEANIDVDSKLTAYNEATANFAEIIQSNTEADEKLSAIISEIEIYEGQKNALQGQITTQEGVVSEATTLVSTLSSSLSSLQEPPKTIEYFNEETQETQTQDNPAYAQYLQQKEALENELAAAEQDLAKQEEELQTLKDDLDATEDGLEVYMLSYMAAREESGTLTEAEKEAMAAVDAAKAEYDSAKGEIAKIESQYDKDIDALQAQLIAYNDAITEKELTLPEGYSSEDGELTNGENNLLYLEDGKLPDGYKIVDGKIVDADDNTVGLVTGDEENQQLYLIQEKEPESIGYANAYYTAATLFQDTLNADEETRNQSWSDIKFSEFSADDIALIQEIYDSFVSDYNSDPENADKPASNFIETAEQELNDEEATQVTFDIIQNALKKVDDKVEVQPNNFANYLETNGVDLATATPEQLSELLDKFIVDKYGFDYKEEYYPELTDEQLEQYIGEGGLDSLKDADETTVQSKIDTILNDDTLSPYQQMRLVDMIKSYSADTTTYVQNYFTNSDEFFYSTIEEMTAEGSEYSTEDVLEFVRQYKGLDSSSSVLGNGENIDVILSIYTMASDDNAALSELDTYLNAGKVLEFTQQNFEGAELEAYTDLLFKATVADNLTENGMLSVKPEDYGLTPEEAENLKTTYTNVEDVMAGLDSGILDKSTAQYLISNIFGGDPTKISDVQGVGNDNTVNQIFKLFGTEPYEPFLPDTAMTYEYIQHDNGVTYMLIAPEGVDPDAELPVIMYLPGSGEYKGGESALTGYNTPSTILGGWDEAGLEGFNGYILVPTMVNRQGIPNWANEDAEGYVREVFADFQSTHNVNEDMVFVGGHSLGGTGALYMAEHADDLFSKAFVLSGYSSYSYDINNIKIPIIGYNGNGDSGFMTSTFAQTFGDESLVNVNTYHGAVPVPTFTKDVDGNHRVDLFEWLLEDKELPEGSDDF